MVASRHAPVEFPQDLSLDRVPDPLGDLLDLPGLVVDAVGLNHLTVG